MNSTTLTTTTNAAESAGPTAVASASAPPDSIAVTDVGDGTSVLPPPFHGKQNHAADTKRRARYKKEFEEIYAELNTASLAKDNLFNESNSDDDAVQNFRDALVTIIAAADVDAGARRAAFHSFIAAMQSIGQERKINWQPVQRGVLGWAKTGYKESALPDKFYNMDGSARTRQESDSVDPYWTGQSPAERAEAARVTVEHSSKSEMSAEVMKLYEQATPLLRSGLEQVELCPMTPELEKIDQAIAAIDPDRCLPLNDLRLHTADFVVGHVLLKLGKDDTVHERGGAILQTIKTDMAGRGYPVDWADVTDGAAGILTQRLQADPSLVDKDLFLKNRVRPTLEEIGVLEPLGMVMNPSAIGTYQTSKLLTKENLPGHSAISGASDENRSSVMSLDPVAPNVTGTLRRGRKGFQYNIQQTVAVVDGKKVPIAAVLKIGIHYQVLVKRFEVIDGDSSAAVWHVLPAGETGVNASAYLGTPNAVEINRDNKGTKAHLKGIGLSDLDVLGVAYRPMKAGKTEYGCRPQQLALCDHPNFERELWFNFSVLAAKYKPVLTQDMLDEVCRMCGDQGLDERLEANGAEILVPQRKKKAKVEPPEQQSGITTAGSAPMFVDYDEDEEL